jgi:FAD/FMN-containing dehydrogenase
MSEIATELSTEIERLAGRLTGRVHLPGEAGYDDERTGFQRRTVHRPAVVVEPRDAADVCAAVGFAAAHGTRVAVQASGHGLAAGMDGGVLLSTRAMRDVRVDARARTAWVPAGAAWSRVIEAAAPYGLAPLSGSSPGVGAVSYTLGGGVGLLARRYGFAADHVRRVELVTAHGRLRGVAPAADPDLFWALRGGGGNVGVVTGMEIDLVPVDWLYGGGLYFDVREVPHVLRAWREWTATVDEAMTSAVTVLPFPDVPAVPAELRGRHVAQVQIAYLGSAAGGERATAPLRALGRPLRDTLRELPYADSGAVFDDPDRPHAYLSYNRLLADLDPAALATLTERAGPSAPVMCVVGLRHLGGALAREPHVPNAVGHRDAAYSLTVISPVEPGGEEEIRGLHRSVLAPFSARALGRSLNFSYGPLAPAEVASAFDPEDYRRLAALRAKHDPHGLFQPNHPVPVAP